jgi:predicted metal-dependent hydrolase
VADLWILCAKRGVRRMDSHLWQNASVLPHDLNYGLDLFNHAEFFEAHEALEDVWRAAPMPEKKFLQGLIQVAVALHHHGKGNLVGARSLLKRASRNLSLYPENFGGINLDSLLNSISDWQHALDEGRPVPPPPKIVVGRQASVVKKTFGG